MEQNKKTRKPRRTAGPENQAVLAAERAKRAYRKTKEKAKESTEQSASSAEDYAANRITQESDRISADTAYLAERIGSKSVAAARENFRAKREQERLHRSAVESAGVARAAGTTSETARRTASAARRTTEQVAAATKAGAEAAAKASQKAAEASRAAAKASAKGAKAAARAAKKVIRSIIIAGVKATVTAIIAGGWIAVVVIVVIGLVALLASSAFGIFFSGESTGDPNQYPMPQAVQEISTDYEKELQEIIESTPHDSLEMEGEEPDWKEVLAIYAVKTSMDPDNPQEVATMDAAKQELLEDVFRDMNELESRTESYTETEIVETVDKDGNLAEQEVTETYTRLIITQIKKSATEMADFYGFNKKQTELLIEILKVKNEALWRELFKMILSEQHNTEMGISQL